MGPIWGRQDPCWPHYGPMNFIIWECIPTISWSYFCSEIYIHNATFAKFRLQNTPKQPLINGKKFRVNNYGSSNAFFFANFCLSLLKSPKWAVWLMQYIVLFCHWINDEHMMTSSNGNIFRVTGPLCGEFTGPGEFPEQRPVTRSFDVFFDLCLNKRLSKQTIVRLVIWDAIVVIMTSM